MGHYFLDIRYVYSLYYNGRDFSDEHQLDKRSNKMYLYQVMMAWTGYSYLNYVRSHGLYRFLDKCITRLLYYRGDGI